MSNLAVSYSMEQNHAEARKRYESVLDIERRVLGPEHPDTLLTMHALAKSLAKLGKAEQSHSLFEQTLEIQCRVMGPEHPHTLSTSFDLAIGLWNQGKHAEALARLVRVVDADRRVLGPDHPSTRDAKYTYVELLVTSPDASDRDRAQGLELARKAVELSPDDEMDRYYLGWVQYRVGDWKGCLESLGKMKGGTDDTFFEAMAHWQLGEKARARIVFDKADPWLRGYEPRFVGGHPRPDVLRQIRDEAAVLLGMNPPQGETKSKTAPGTTVPPK